MEAKFTKGEWKIDNNILTNEYGAKEISINCEGLLNIISVWCSGLISNEEAEANAKLIAAAPVMYEALAIIRSMCDRNVDKENIIWHKVTEALQKATE